jgi:Arabinose-binding domain of AraC transcription regulator, N-term
MTDLIRSASLTHYPEVARSVGLDPIAMLRKVRLPVACLDHPDLRIAVSALRRLLEASAAAAGVDEFGLRMADRGGLANLGPVALVVREQATVGNAIEALSRFIHIHHEGMALRIERDDDVVTLSVTLRGGRPRAPRQSTEMAVGTIHRIIRSLFGDDWQPLDVHLMHSPPRNRRYYRSFFGCNVIFNSEIDAILVAAERPRAPDSSGASLDRGLSAAAGRSDQVAVKSVGRQGRRTGPRTAAGRGLHDRARGRTSCLRPPNHSPPSGGARHQLLRNSGYRARRPRDAIDRGRRPAVEGNGGVAGLLGAKRHGALVSRTVRLQHHPMANG